MADTVEKYLDYRGEIRAVSGAGPAVSFVTVHPEGQATALYTIHLEKDSLEAVPLPAGGAALIADGETRIVAGNEGQLYEVAPGAKQAAPLGAPLAAAPLRLAMLRGSRLAALLPDSVVIADRKGKPLQTLPVPDGSGTVLAADDAGQWLVVGSSTGHLYVFECDEKKGVSPAESGQLHSGPVTALMFDPAESRVLSMGADNRLLSTHVRGALEPEDKGGRGGHEKSGRAFVAGEERFYTAGDDGQIKAWPHGASRARPASFKDGVGRTVAMTAVTVNKRPHLVTAADDRTLRVFLVDPSGKVSHCVQRIHDGYALAKRELGQDAKRRRGALRQLAAYNDGPAVELLAERAVQETEHSLRVLAAELLGALDNPRIGPPLEQLLKNKDAALAEVRLAALRGLRRLAGETALPPLILALETGQPDVGEAAVAALAALAGADDQAMTRLVQALEDEPKSVRFAALAALEEIHGDAPTPHLMAAQSRHSDLRWWTLIRLVQRGLLGGAEVKGAVRRLTADKDGQVRQTAFLLSLLAVPPLADNLRRLDKDLHRRLFQVETHGADKKLPSPPKAPPLEPAHLEPLLEAMASRSLDICVSGALYLATLKDPRALGTLLQLSAERKSSSRVSAARALALLGDQRALRRLCTMLHDKDRQVRDAAYTAVETLCGKTPLAAVEAALVTEHEDVRLRGLNTLVQTLRKKPPKEDHPGYRLLLRGLSDSARKIRTEAFKAVLNLKVGGDADATLRFVARSIHADIRREVLTEVMAEIRQPWAFPLLLDLLDDPDPGLRKEVFEFAAKQLKKHHKGRDQELFERALGGRFEDVRFEAVERLARQPRGIAETLLVRALEDDAAPVRLAAIDAIERADHAAGLTAAMKSAHRDVAIRAAATKAAWGDAAAAAPLLAQIEEEKPQIADLADKWRRQVIMALSGLAALEDDATSVAIRKLVDSKDAEIRCAAAEALIWTAAGARLDGLAELLQHDDKAVRQRIAWGLAVRGDPAGASLLFSNMTAALKSFESLVAAVMLDEAELFNAFLDAKDDDIRLKAFWLMLMKQWRAPESQVNIAGLSSADPRTRLRSARALEALGDLGPFLTEQLNDRGDHAKPWQIPLETIRALAHGVIHGSRRQRARAALILKTFDEPKQEAFDHAWTRHRRRYGEASPESAGRPDVDVPREIGEVIIGAYTGLSRAEGGGAAVKVRLTALERLLAVAGDDLQRVAPVFVQALGDSAATVRGRAFEILAQGAADKTALAAAALATGIEDMGRAGLALLARSDDGEALLESVLRTKTDGLEVSAADLLAERRDPIHVAVLGIDAASRTLRQRAVERLAEHYDDDERAAAALEKALGSRFEQVRYASAVALAQKRAAAAFEPLVALLKSVDPRWMSSVVNGLVALGDPRTPDALLDRYENDPAGTADVTLLFQALGDFRRPEDVPRVLGFLEPKKTRKAAFKALRKISGYDQRFGFDEEDDTATAWLEGLHPHRHDVLAQLLEAAFKLGESQELKALLGFAKWPDDGVVDGPLGAITGVAEESIRHQAVEAAGYRLRKRNGPAEPLVAALSHKDAKTQFLAAEGLARAGRSDGITILLTAVDLLDDIGLRRRAVKALGELGDERALDKLLKLAGEDQHALQEAAAQALGHLAHTAKAEEIFKLLERLTTRSAGVAGEALKGLRFFNTADAWALIRERAADGDWRIREIVAEALGHSDDPGDLERLAKIIKADDDWDVVKAAAKSLRRRHGPDSLEPDYVFIQSFIDDLEEHTLKRLCDQGEAARLLDVLPKVHRRCEGIFYEPLVAALLRRTPPPVSEAAAALGSRYAKTVRVAARIIGRVPSEAASHKDEVASALSGAAADWAEAHERLLAPDRTAAPSELADIAARLTALLYACERLETGEEAIRTVLALEGPDAYLLDPLAAALAALPRVGGAGAAADLERFAVHPNARLREIAAWGLAEEAPEKAAGVLSSALDDRNVVRRLTAREDDAVAEALRTGAFEGHVQGIVLPRLIARGDVAGLTAVVKEKAADEPTVLGAVEALGRLGTDAAMAIVLELAKDEGRDEALRKAAWRTLRRTRRRNEKGAGPGRTEVSK